MDVIDGGSSHSVRAIVMSNVFKHQLTSVFSRQPREGDMRVAGPWTDAEEAELQTLVTLSLSNELQDSKKRKRIREELLQWTRTPVDREFTFSGEGPFCFELVCVMFKHQLTCVFFRESAFVTLC